MPLFRSKKKLPEVNYFQGGSAWTDNTLTIMAGSLPDTLILTVGAQERLYAKDYAGNTIAKVLPYSLLVEPITSGICNTETKTGNTHSSGYIAGISINIAKAGNLKLTFSNCLINKVLTVTIISE